jgi:hypothetical protein
MVPYLGGGLVIGIIAIIHVFVSHFAIGGGFFIALTEHLAYKRQDNRLYDYLKQHSKFFLLVTTLIGVVTGPGIWWAISLVSPDATEVLIQNFALFWSLEYLIFAAEIATFFVYYYTWGKVSQKTHLKLAWMYGGISLFTLILINGILTFMLTPGQWFAPGATAGAPVQLDLMAAFFNPGYWPSCIIRILIMLALAGMYALITSAGIKDFNFRRYMLRYSAKWLLPVFFIGPLVAFWYFNVVQVEAPSTIDNILNGIQSSGVGNFSILARALYLSLILSGTLLIFAFVGPYLNPRGFSKRSALAFLMSGLIVTGITEWTREMLRKPYVIYGYMYSNGLLNDPKAIARYNTDGFFQTANWAKNFHPEKLSSVQRGELMFRFQCMACHSHQGYRSMARLLGERDLDAIKGFLGTLHKTDPKENPYSRIMPPLVGKQNEMDDLAQYLDHINKKPQEAAYINIGPEEE